jgi:hypothetical protein
MLRGNCQEINPLARKTKILNGAEGGLRVGQSCTLGMRNKDTEQDLVGR